MGALVHMLLGGLDQAGCGSVRLPAAMTAAGAGTAVYHDHSVAQLGAGKIAAGINLVVNDDAAADTRSQSDGHSVVGALQARRPYIRRKPRRWRRFP